jgi:chromatin segregation and condensation protein Rec8/ScpA/Scc1 (kleisin family)
LASPEQAAELERLAALLNEAQRGELDLGTVELATLTRSLKDEVASANGEMDLLWAAESLQILAKLLEIKMGRHLEDTNDAALLGHAEPLTEEEDPGERLAEYRLFRAAAGVLLADSSAGPKAFLRVLGLPVEPRATLHLNPEILALALGELLARLPEPTELELALPHPRYSVSEKMDELRSLLGERRKLRFDQVFAAARDRLEAVALFMALLELIWTGEVVCSQVSTSSPILVERAGGS